MLTTDLAGCARHRRASLVVCSARFAGALLPMAASLPSMAPLRTARMTAPAGRARYHTAAAVGFEVRPCTEHMQHTGILHTHSTRPLWRRPPATQRCPIHCHCRVALRHLQLRSKLLVVAACVWTIWRASPPSRSQMQSCALRRSRCADTTTTSTTPASASAVGAPVHSKHPNLPA